MPNNEQEYIEIEDRKYSELYNSGNYHPCRQNERLIQWMERIKYHHLFNKDVIEIGCGLAPLIRSKAIEPNYYYGIDISSAVIEKNIQELRDFPYDFGHGAIHNLSTPDNEDQRYDLSICVDVMEHIPTDRVEQCLKIIAAVSKASVFTISLRPSTTKAFNGDNLHLTVKDQNWWSEKLLFSGAVLRVEQFENDNVAFLVKNDNLRSLVKND